jgi:hypothetical protein
MPAANHLPLGIRWRNESRATRNRNACFKHSDAEILGNLDSAKFTVRDRATKELEALGEAAEPALHHGRPAIRGRKPAKSVNMAIRFGCISRER